MPSSSAALASAISLESIGLEPRLVWRGPNFPDDFPLLECGCSVYEMYDVIVTIDATWHILK